MPIRLACRCTRPTTRCAREIMPVNDRYPLPTSSRRASAGTRAARRMVFIEYVMLRGVNDRYAQAVRARRPARPARLQGQPDPVQPDRDRYDGSVARGDRRVPGGARGARAARHRAAHARARHRRRLRPARREAPRRLAARRPRRAVASARAGARLAGLEQPLAQVGLLLGRRVPRARRRAASSSDGQAEELEEQRRRAVEDRAELRAPGLLDQPALEQRRRRPSRRRRRGCA